MANTLLTNDVIAQAALATLYEKTVMLPLVYSDVSSEWQRSQKIGDTVNIRKPAVFTANKFDPVVRNITVQNATETSVPVTLNHIPDVSFQVTSEDLTLEVTDFAEQFLAPALEAISQYIDREILKLRDDITQEAGAGAIVDPANPAYDESLLWHKPEVLIEAGRVLDLRNVPESQRTAVVGPTTKAKWLNSDLLKRVDQSGDTAALRRASIGNDLFGFAGYQTQNVGQPAQSPTTGQPTTEVGLAFHKTAFAFASAPLAVDPSSNGVTRNYKGLNLRIVSDYDIKSKATIFSIDTLFGVKTLDPNRAVLLKGADAA